jgi:hypothetical protein
VYAPDKCAYYTGSNPTSPLTQSDNVSNALIDLITQNGSKVLRLDQLVSITAATTSESLPVQGLVGHQDEKTRMRLHTGSQCYPLASYSKTPSNPLIEEQFVPLPILYHVFNLLAGRLLNCIRAKCFSDQVSDRICHAVH